ncbi:MAG: hypothetical protein FWD71_19970 [Oscillospiraceae bacterium]|nr:hypothetical protein [Oscillospiraceae bacterium]
MPNKNFKDINNPAMAYISNTQDVQEELNEQDVQDTQVAYNTQRAPGAHNVQNTQRIKGQKLPRINMAFSPGNLEYLQIISRIEGVSITEYVNRLIIIDRSSRESEIKKAKAILK